MVLEAFCQPGVRNTVSNICKMHLLVGVGGIDLEFAADMTACLCG